VNANVFQAVDGTAPAAKPSAQPDSRNSSSGSDRSDGRPTRRRR
jgi:hypothetical protein